MAATPAHRYHLSSAAPQTPPRPERTSPRWHYNLAPFATPFLDAGASPEKANAAAEELAGYDSRLAKIERDLVVLKWMIGALYPLISAILLKLFLH